MTRRAGLASVSTNRNIDFLSTSGGYNPNQCYIYATDANGHRERVQLSIPPNVFDRMGEMVANGDMPYRSMNEFFRDALIHRLKYWADATNLPELQDAVELMLARESVAMEKASRDSMKKLVEETKALLQEMYDDGDSSNAARILDEHRILAERLSEPWRGKILSMIYSFEKRA